MVSAEEEEGEVAVLEEADALLKADLEQAAHLAVFLG